MISPVLPYRKHPQRGRFENKKNRRQSRCWCAPHAASQHSIVAVVCVCVCFRAKAVEKSLPVALLNKMPLMLRSGYLIAWVA